MNKTDILSKIAECQHRMKHPKAYSLVCTLTLASVLALSPTSYVEAAEIKSGLQNTPIRRAALDTLSNEQTASIMEGQITNVPMSWTNTETEKVEWITGFTLVYKPKGKAVLIPVEQGPSLHPILLKFFHTRDRQTPLNCPLLELD